MVRVGATELIWAIAPMAVGFFAGHMTAGAAAPMAVILGIVAYAMISLFLPDLRLFPVFFALGAHAAAVAHLYSDPIPIPLAVIERGEQGAVINVDIVQMILAYELANRLGLLQSLQNLLNTIRSRRSTVT